MTDFPFIISEIELKIPDDHELFNLPTQRVVVANCTLDNENHFPGLWIHLEKEDGLISGLSEIFRPCLTVAICDTFHHIIIG